jgi:hypothetical protein
MFFQPTPDERWTDEAIASLVGQRGDATWMGSPIGEGVITSAKRTTKFGQDGLWIEADMPAVPLLVDTSKVEQL